MVGRKDSNLRLMDYEYSQLVTPTHCYSSNGCKFTVTAVVKEITGEPVSVDLGSELHTDCPLAPLFFLGTHTHSYDPIVSLNPSLLGLNTWVYSAY